MNNYYNQFFSETCKHYSLVLENDERVCYAYLLSNDKIVGDVWIFNQIETPANTDWTNKGNMPFLNPIAFAVDDMKALIMSEPDDIEVKWIFSDSSCILDRVVVYIKGSVAAILKENAKPGWSVNAKENGPLAKKLINE